MSRNINWDAIGITASAACAIHCAILPLIFTTLPLFGMNIIHNAVFEIGMIVLTILIGAYTFYHSFKKHHHSYLPGGLFIFGIILLVTKELLHELHLLFLIPAVICIITSHFLNYSMCRKHNHAHNDDCNH